MPLLSWLRRLAGVIAWVAVVALSATAIAQTEPATGEQNGQSTGLPLPRFVSLAGNVVNLRTGPGVQYPVRWVLQRRGMPVKIIGEDENWRMITDFEGTEGWIHSGLLSSRRTVVITGEVRELRRSAAPDARVLLRAEPGVTGDLIDCNGDWCLVEINEVRGWMDRAAIWGVLESEMRD